ncbi:MAG: hypothetical protein ABIU95_15335 [Burkholderiales bacterium]
MESLLPLAARLGAFLGVLLCIVPGVARLAGAYWLAGFQLQTLFSAGVALMVFACMCYLMVLAEYNGGQR